MTDHEIIQGLIARNDIITKEFFFVRCRPLFCNIIKKVFGHSVDYDEFVNELYLYLMTNDAAKLRSFEYRSTLYQWLKVLAVRFFINKRNQTADNKGKTLNVPETQIADVRTDITAQNDVERLLGYMPNRRYAQVIRRLVIEGCETEHLAQEMHISTANLYNIKRRAMTQLYHVAIKDIKEYGKQ